MRRLATSCALAITGLALAGNPCLAESPGSLFSSGYANHQTGNLTEAIRLYTKAIDIDDRYVMAYQMRAAAWQKLHKFSRAIDDYSVVIAIGETTFRAAGYLNRGIVRNMSGQYSEAIADFDQAIAIDKYMGPAYFHRAIARSKTGDTIGNMDDFIRAARLGDPDAERLLDARNPGWRQIRKPQ